MEAVKKYAYQKLTTMLSGQQVRFISDCELFPNFDVIGKVMHTYMKGTELIFKVKTTTGKLLDIGSNMKNLRFQITQRQHYQH